MTELGLHKGNWLIKYKTSTRVRNEFSKEYQFLFLVTCNAAREFKTYIITGLKHL